MEQPLPKIRVKYRRARFTVRALKPKVCEFCGREGKIDLHHWQYAFSTDCVRLKPELALKHASWLCFPCHQRGDAMRTIRGMLYHERVMMERLMEAKL